MYLRLQVCVFQEQWGKISNEIVIGTLVFHFERL